ncbi:unnamed protein product [Protopolystoma xenopodis]|uniref:Uncharacterized protein n=1 Tax=Protopolystoma xenopodis TaxID=117903 RepID=A0A448X165_9PLAT|nr:unnamed protein product [Protopolystoma xenopodis]
MMIRCAFWDLMSKGDLDTDANGNAGRASAILIMVFNFHLSVIKKYSFGDVSDKNVAFLYCLIDEISKFDYPSVRRTLLDFCSKFPRLGQNLRIFMRRHFKEDTDLSRKNFIMRLILEMRECEQF